MCIPGGLRRSDGCSVWVTGDCAVPTATSTGTRPSPGSPVPQSSAQQSSRSLQDCQRMINDQQARNCPDCRAGCCLTRCLMGSDVLQQAASPAQPRGAGAHTCPPSKLPCAPCCSGAAHLGSTVSGATANWGKNPPEPNSGCGGVGQAGMSTAGMLDLGAKPQQSCSAGQHRTSPWAPPIPLPPQGPREAPFGGSAPGRAFDRQPHSFVLVLFVSSVWPGHRDS